MRSRAERQAARQSRREKRRAEKERRQDRNDARRAARKEARYQHSMKAERTRRQAQRQENRNERVRLRQEGRTERVSERQESQRTAYENGIDPNEWKGNAIMGAEKAVSELGSTAMEVFGGRKGRRDKEYSDSTPDENTQGNPQKKTGLMIGIVAGVGLLIAALFMMLTGKKKKF